MIIDAPIPLSNPFPKLDVDLPPILNEIVQAFSKQYQLDPAIPLATALGCIATATRGRYKIKLTQDWIQHSSLYIVIIAKTADGKSQVMNRLRKPIQDAEAQAISDARSHRALQEAQFEIAKDQLEAIKKGMSNPKKGGKAITYTDADLANAIDKVQQLEPDPLPLWVLGGDVTGDRLTELLQIYPSLAILETEGILFQHLSGRKHNTGTSYETILSATTGDTIKSHRIGRGDAEAKDPHLVICAAVQPDVWRELYQDRTATSRGVTGRFLPFVAESMQGRRDVSASEKYPIPQDLINQWESLLNEILMMQDHKIVEISPKSRELWHRWREEHERNLADPANELDGFGARLPGHIAVIGWLLTLAKDPQSQMIDDDCLETAIYLADYLISHRKLADSLKLERSPEHRILDRISSIIRKREQEIGDGGDAIPTFEISTRDDLQQSMKQQSWVKEGGIDAINNALKNLEMKNWIYTGRDEWHWTIPWKLIKKYHQF